ncbi:MAG TPA: hypothetical protein VIE13_10825, partial [Terriglobales bacterium]
MRRLGLEPSRKRPLWDQQVTFYECSGRACDAQNRPRYAQLRENALDLARAIEAYVPAGPGQTAAIEHVRQAVMCANAGIACGEAKLEGPV